MFQKVLIANRGEIACRIVRTARRLGVKTVAVASEADARALHVELADEVQGIGPPPATESYLNIERILDAAKASGADAVHPGYGFLSENADFAEACASAGLCFIGPAPATMRSMGAKDEAKTIARAAGVPVVPGYMGDGDDDARLIAEAKAIGLPLMVKAVAGGGGRGMRQVTAESDIAAAIESARREAAAAFGDGRLMLEKLIVEPRHVEVQVFGDRHGNVVHLFERDCSLQRRHQKVIEEAPAPGMSEALRARMTGAAVALAKSVGYEGAGTVEFLLEGRQAAADADFYFIEMNTRLQVEHPVTELVTGLDLVEWQFRVADGEALPLAQDEIALNGHAVEARLYAEDPAHDFQPSSGKLYACDLPDGDGVRIDTGVRAGDEVSPFYDPMIAKVIAKGDSREIAFARLAAALSEVVVLGPRTNAAFLYALAQHADVLAGDVHTGLIGEALGELTDGGVDDEAVAAGLAGLFEQDGAGAVIAMPGAEPWATHDAFQLGGVRRVPRSVLVDGETLPVALVWGEDGLQVDFGEAQKLLATSAGNGAATILVDDGDRALVWHRLRQTEVAWPRYSPYGQPSGDAAGDITAPITGRVVAMHVGAGDVVDEGTAIVVIEAMKMEHVLAAAIPGVVGEVAVSVGDQVIEGALVAHIVSADEDA